jgi:membrane associated rhomboid family serine protease
MSFLLLAIILINAAFTYQGLNDYSFFERYKFNVGAIRRGEYHRFVTSAFLHAGWGHFLFNMITLYFFYKPVVFYTGTTGFLLIYFGGMLLGNFLAYYFHKNESFYTAVGNSGAVNAVVFSAILFNPDASIIILPIPIPIPAYIYAVGYLLYTTFGMKNLNDNIGHEAHFGGAAAGIVFSVLLMPELIRVRMALLLILSAVIVGGFVYARKRM